MNHSHENDAMRFPIVIIKPNEAPIYYLNKGEFGLVSKKGESFYKKGTIYDSEGNKYIINGIGPISKAPFLRSLKNFQQMYEVEVNYAFTGKVTLEDFKSIVISHLKTFKKYWLSRDTFEALSAPVAEKNSFVDIITFLK